MGGAMSALEKVAAITAMTLISWILVAFLWNYLNLGIRALIGFVQ